MTETPQQAARRLAAGAIRQGYAPEGLHVYTAADGEPLHWRIRLKHPDRGDKWVRPMKLSGGGYALGEPPYPGGKPLYQLHELVARPNDTVIVVEGEKCADALTKTGVLATTSGAADSAGDADWGPLAGRTVVVWPDNDEAGRRYAESVVAALRALGCTVYVIDVRALNLPVKGDAVDWLAAHPAASAEDVLALQSHPAAPEPLSNRPGTGAVNIVTDHVIHDDAADSTTDWPDPQPLPTEEIEVQELDLDLLPDALRPWIADICDQLQCPPDFVAVPAVVALGGLLGRKLGIRPQARTDWTAYPNVWGCIVGRPGTMKSPAVAEALRPLRQIEARARAEYDDRRHIHDAEVEFAKLRRDAAKNKALAALKKGESASMDDLLVTLPDTPTCRRYTTNDSGYEALGELLRQNPNGLLVERDEVASLLTYLGQEQNASARGFFLTGADATSGYTFDRITRGLDLQVPRVCLSILGTTQPSRIATFLQQALVGGNGDDGMIQRFGLLVWPRHSREWRNVDRWPDTEARRMAYAVFDGIEALNPANAGATIDGEDAYLRFAPDALEAFTEWRIKLETKIRSDDLHPAMEAHLAKYRKTIPALALICHLADRGTGAVALPATLRALAWADYLETHAQRAYCARQASVYAAAQRICDNIRKGKLGTKFRARDLVQKDWSGLTDATVVEGALSLLATCHWLAEEQSAPGTPGRPTVTYHVNPKAQAR